MKISVSLVLLLSLPSIAFGHDWYSNSCCGGQDCHPVNSCSEITEDQNGYYSWGRYHFAPVQVQPSQDNKCHVCIHQYSGPTGKDSFPVCIYIQEGV